MSTPRTTAATAALAAAVLVLAGLVAPTSTAVADEPATPPSGAPVTRADRVTVASDSAAEIDVLANDTDPDDPSSGDLEICRVEPSADAPFSIGASTGFDESDYDTGGHPVMSVFPNQADPGTYTFTYYVCDYDYLTAATLTVEVIGAQNPYADVVTARPGYVRFHNPGKRRAVIQYGSKDGRTVDGKFALAARTARTVRITRRAIRWTATILTRDGRSTYGSLLNGIKQPSRPSPSTSAGLGSRTAADRTAWRLGTRQIELRARPRSSQPVAPATAGRDESTDAPLAAPDTAEVSQGYFGLADVLANDSDPDGSDDDLGICRASAPAGSGLVVTPIAGDHFIVYSAGRGRAPRAATTVADDPLPYTLLVQAEREARRGTYDITYYACDHQYLTPGTVTVTVTKSQLVTARKLKNRRGVVRFTNPGPHGSWVRVRSLEDASVGGQRLPLVARFRLPAGTSRSIRPRVRQILWIASSRRGPGGSGVIGGIGRPPRG